MELLEKLQEKETCKTAIQESEEKMFSSNNEVAGCTWAAESGGRKRCRLSRSCMSHS